MTTPASGPPSTGTWRFANNETQLLVTPAGGAARTQEVFGLSATSFSVGYRFTQAQVQAALAGQPVPGVPAGLITLILLSASDFTFPAGTPVFDASKITSLELRTNLVPK